MATPEAPLGSTSDPVELLRGDLEAIAGSVTDLRALAAAVEATADGLDGLDPQGWSGEAADAFRSRFAAEPPRWRTAADALGSAAEALADFGHTVAGCQDMARTAAEQYERGRLASVAARAEYNAAVENHRVAVGAAASGAAVPPPAPAAFVDPGEADMRAAEELLARARERRDAEAARAASRLAVAAAAAPPGPGLLGELTGTLSESADSTVTAMSRFGAGAIDSIEDTIKSVRAMNPNDSYNRTHPAAYIENNAVVGTGLLRALSRPLETLKGVVGTGWGSDPAYAAGRLAPDVAAAVATRGTSLIAGAGRRAVTGGARLGDQADADGPGNQPLGGRTVAGDPIDVVTGQFVLSQTDLVLPGALPLVLERTHLSGYRSGRLFGSSWASTLDERLEVDDDRVCFARADGLVMVYPPLGGVAVLPAQSPRWPLAAGPDGGLTVTDPDTEQVRHFAAPVDGVARLTAVTDAAGHRIAVERTTDGTPTALSHSGGYRVEITTDRGRVTRLGLGDGSEILRFAYSSGDLVEIVNSSGAPLRLTYDTRGRVTSWTDRNGVTLHNRYDRSGRCVRQSGPDGVLAARLVYRPGRTEVVDAHGAVRVFDHDERARVVREVDPHGGETLRSFDATGRMLLARTDADGATTRWEYDEAERVVVEVDPAGGVRRVERDPAGRPVSVVEPDGAVWRQSVDERGLRTRLVDPLGTVTTYEHDARGHLAAVVDALGARTGVETDDAGLPLTVVDPLGATTRWTYDAAGRPLTVTDPLGAVTRMEWTPEGRLRRRVAPDGQAETWAHDGEGNLVAHTDADGRTTLRRYGPFDVPVARIDPDGARTVYTYDANLALVAVVDPLGRRWTYHRDVAGRVVAETDFDGHVTRYALDAVGRVRSRSVPGGTTTFTHDVRGLLVERRSDAGTTTFDHDALGRLVSASGPDADLVRRYDPVGRLVAETVGGRTVTSTHDVLGRRVERRTPSGAVSRWEYDEAGRPRTLDAGGAALSFLHDPAGREITRDLGAARMDRRHDAAGRRLVQELAGPAGTARRTWRYRGDGSPVTIDDDQGRRRMTLDPCGRVTSVDGPGWRERYVHGPTGDVIDAVWPASPADRDLLGARRLDGTRIERAGRVRYRHDERGRLIMRRRTRPGRPTELWQYHWDADDRLLGVITPDGTRWRYRYDPLGRRIAKQRLSPAGDVVEQVDTVWDGATIAEVSSAGSTTTWDHEPDGLAPVAQREEHLSDDEVDRRFYAVVTDLVGTPTELVASDGTIAGRARSTLWGHTTWTGPASTPLRFPGQIHDPESGLHYNVLRYYDPDTARYTTADPLGLAPAPNPRAYVPNPLTWTDPLGLMGCTPLRTDRRQIEKKFKHAADFGVTEPRGKAGFAQFEQALADFVSAPTTTRVEGHYRGNEVILNYNPSSQLVVIQSPSGDFVSGWLMLNEQMLNVVHRRRL